MTARVLVIGLGYFSQFHLEAWATQEGAALVGVCDRDAARADAQGRRMGVAHGTDAAEMVASLAPDIVDIVAPPPAHDALVRAALSPGRMVICQKPFATSISEAEALVTAAKDVGCQLVIHENFRFQPWYREIHDLLSAGQMGTIWQARFALRPGDGRGPRAYLDRQPAFQTMPRLLVHETAVHFLDTFRFLFGPVTSIYADLRRLNPVLAGEDAGHLLLTHEGGVRSDFDGNRLADHVASNPRRTMGEMEIVGEAGTLTLDGDGRLWLRAFGRAEARALPLRHPVDPDRFGGGCVAALIAHLVQARAMGTPPENTASEYLEVMRLSAAAYVSNTEHRALTREEIACMS